MCIRDRTVEVEIVLDAHVVVFAVAGASREGSAEDAVRECDVTTHHEAVGIGVDMNGLDVYKRQVCVQ